MLPSWRLARNWLAGRPGRLALMIGAVTLASALVVAVSCAVASVQKSLELGITNFLGRSDARVIHQFNGRFEEALLDTVRGWPGVRTATARLVASLTLTHADERRDDKGEILRASPMAIGVDFAAEAQVRPQTLLAGRTPSGPGEVLIDPLAAEQLQARVGDALVVQRFGEPIPLRVAGIIDRPRLPALQRPLIEMARPLLAEAANLPGQLTSIVIMLDDEVDVNAFCRAHGHALPEALALEPSDRVRAGFDRQIHASHLGFVVASVLTFMSAAFIIVTAMTTSVTQRQREMAVARCVGAARSQLFASQMFAGLTISIIGSLLGVPLGIALTALLYLFFREYLPAGLAIHPLGLQLALGGAVAAGLAAALYPAWLASHVAPLQAMSMQARPPRARSIIVACTLGMVLLAGSAGLLTIDDPSQRFLLWAYAGLPLVHVAYFILATPVLVLAARMLAPALEALLRLPRGMLRRSMLATPFRNGFTAGALMVGMGILVSTWSNAVSLMDDWLGRIRFADAFAFRAMGITPGQRQAIENLPFIAETCAIGYLPVQVLDRQVFGVRGIATPNVTIFAVDFRRFTSMNTVDWVAGDRERALARLADGSGIVVADRFLTTQRIALGDRLKLGSGRVQAEFEVVAAISSAGLDIVTQIFGIRSQYLDISISSVFMDSAVVARVFDFRDVLMLQANLRDDVTDEQATRAVEAAAPGVAFRSGREIMNTVNEIASAALAVQTTIAFAALLLASLGVGNVLLANIHGRRFEYGVLRAVGGQRGLLARLIFGEAALLALTGAAVGTALGLHLAAVGAMQYRELAGLPVRFNLPLWPTLAGWAVLLLLALAAALPGVRSVIRPQPGTLLAGGRHG